MKETNKGIGALKKCAYKAKLWAIGIASFFATQQEVSAALKSGTDEKKTNDTEEMYKISKDVKTAKERFATFKLADEHKELKIGGVYKGVYMDFAQMEAPDIGHLFESGMNPYITGSGGKYLGLYQMDTGDTMKAFLFGTKSQNGDYNFEGAAKEYPALAKLGKTEAGRKSPEFVKMFGGLSKTQKFRYLMDKFMHDVKYKKVFDALRQIPDLDFDNRGEVFKGSVMSAINQNSKPSVICDIFSKALNAAKAVANKEKREVSTADIIKYSYDARKARWGLAARYKEENRLCQDALVFEQTMQRINLAQKAKDEEVKKMTGELKIPSMTVLTEITAMKADALSVKIKPIVPEIIKDKKSIKKGSGKNKTLNQLMIDRKRGRGS